MHLTRHVLANVAGLLLATSLQAADPANFDWNAHGFGPGVTGNEGDNGWIGIFADPQATQPCATIPTGQFATLYVFAFLDGGTKDGLTGAEFRIQVTKPEGYQFVYAAPPRTVTLGNPFDLTPDDPLDGTGLNIAFQDCQTSSRVPMGTILVYNASGAPTELQVRRRNGPSNPGSNCPLFTDCTFQYAPQCMSPCMIDATGGAIVAQAWINDPACTTARDCPVACAPDPCVSIVASASQPHCVDRPITITATVTNCSPVPEDIDVFVAYELAGSFPGVPSGQAVTASRTYVLEGCSGPHLRQPVGAVVRTAGCGHPIGSEISVELRCTQCAPNQYPDCSEVKANLTEIWPPDGRLEPITISGFRDPDGDSLLTLVSVVGSDEPTGIYGSNCPDAIIDGPQTLRLRAERAPNGNGRVYSVLVQALDPAGYGCNKLIDVCVPRKPGVPCVKDDFGYVATSCAPLSGERGPFVFRVQAAPGAGTEIRFSAAAETDATVEVFDMRGRQLATVARSRFGPGEHVLRWDGRDANGSQVATGIYLFRLTAGGNVETTKAIVMQ